MKDLYVNLNKQEGTGEILKALLGDISTVVSVDKTSLLLCFRRRHIHRRQADLGFRSHGINFIYQKLFAYPKAFTFFADVFDTLVSQLY